MTVSSTYKRLRLRVSGIVQGVGFRPFVCKLALQNKLKGFILNNEAGVTIEIEGDAATFEAFITNILHKHPPLARIDTLTQQEIPPVYDDNFSIKASSTKTSTTMLAADMAVCHACLDEMHDPKNRRYHYPFISCNDCGPRYSLLKALPFDRANTAMSDFLMCLECQAEYADPNNRRFHNQAISCAHCGPSLFYLNDKAKHLSSGIQTLKDAALEIQKGNIIALKGLGGFHLLADASNEKAIAKLRSIKKRPTKPFAVMFSDLTQIKKVAILSKDDEHLISSATAPIVIVNKDKTSQFLACNVAPNINNIGVFLAYTGLHLLLLHELETPLLATSANLNSEPIITDEALLFDKFTDTVSAVLTHDRQILQSCEDSVMFEIEQTNILLRMARGYAPLSFPLQSPTKDKILALGGHHKSNITLAFKKNIIVSPFIADLGSLQALEHFEKTLDTFQSFYHFKPSVIVCDLHPHYETTKLAKAWAKKHHLTLIQVQHHHAHALACMAEHKLTQKVLAFCFDGSGYGDDGSIWGGEVLITDTLHYERVVHLRPFRLLGGEAAIKEPRRIALALLFQCYSLAQVLELNIPTTQAFTKEEIKTLHHMYETGINAPLCSSIGRLFDALASLSGLLQKSSYEGESGLLLETASATTLEEKTFSYTLDKGIIDWQPILEEILSNPSPSHVASAFMMMLSHIIIDCAQQYPQLDVVLSGGVFQNKTLLSQVLKMLKDKDIKCYVQEKTPINDGALSLGQVYHALHVMKVKNA